jgi:hypothetical protein
MGVLFFLLENRRASAIWIGIGFGLKYISLIAIPFLLAFDFEWRDLKASMWRAIRFLWWVAVPIALLYVPYILSTELRGAFLVVFHGQTQAMVTDVGVAGLLNRLGFYHVVASRFFLFGYAILFSLFLLYLFVAKELLVRSRVLLIRNVAVAIMLLMLTFPQLQIRYLLWSVPLLIVLTYTCAMVPAWLFNVLWLLWFVMDAMYSNPYEYLIYPQLQHELPLGGGQYGFVLGLNFVVLVLATILGLIARKPRSAPAGWADRTYW